MIYVLANVYVKREFLQQALDCYRDFVPEVLAGERGCLEYVPTTDLVLGLPNQETNDSAILVTERWETVEAFTAHLGMAHSIAFREKMKPWLARAISVRVLRAAL